MRRLIPRKFERKRLIGNVTVRAACQTRAVAALVLDIGQSGISLSIKQGMAKGTLVEVVFDVDQRARSRDMVTREGHVVRSRAYEDNSILGVEFVKALTDEEIQMLEAGWVRS